MSRGLMILTAASAFCLTLMSVQAETPKPIGEVAPIEDLVFEVNERVEELGTLLTSAESYDEHKDSAVRRAFGVLAVLGQAIGEHKDHGETEIQGPALRDAALQYKKNSSLEESQAALEAIKSASAGQSEVEARVEHDWAELINMHPMMEEIEERAGKINRVIRRPRGKPDEPVHASVIALLTVAMHADTHEVKDKADIPAWEGYAAEYLDQMMGVASAIRVKDKDTATSLMVKATETCDKCHEQFRD